MVSIRGNSETRDDAVQNARSRPAKQPVLQAGGRKKGRQIYHNAPLCAVRLRGAGGPLGHKDRQNSETSKASTDMITAVPASNRLAVILMRE